mgnify:CR=1 FL=1
MTPHNKAPKDKIAKTVLMLGDPLRVKFITENFLENYELVNEVRNIYAYTGTYKGKRLTVMAHGMGIPSIGIYAYELFKFYDVETIIRVGSAGSYTKDINVRDIIYVDKAYSDSNFAYIHSGYSLDNVSSSESINKVINYTAKKLNITAKFENIYTTDVFYEDKENNFVKKNNLKAVEMETFGLLYLANFFGKKAASILTISDSFATKEVLSADERQTTFKEMMVLALETVLELEE